MTKPKTKLAHVAINVANIEESVKWYETSFHCEVIEKSISFARLSFENVELHLFLPSQHRTHMAFKKEDAHTYGELLEQIDGNWSTNVADPTGNIIELIGDSPD